MKPFLLLSWRMSFAEDFRFSLSYGLRHPGVFHHKRRFRITIRKVPAPDIHNDNQELHTGIPVHFHAHLPSVLPLKVSVYNRKCCCN